MATDKRSQVWHNAKRIIGNKIDSQRNATSISAQSGRFNAKNNVLHSTLRKPFSANSAITLRVANGSPLCARHGPPTPSPAQKLLSMPARTASPAVARRACEGFDTMAPCRSTFRQARNEDRDRGRYQNRLPETAALDHQAEASPAIWARFLKNILTCAIGLARTSSLFM